VKNLLKGLSERRFLLIVLSIALLTRAINMGFPAFTANEARIAARGYTIATLGKDELGRSFPLLLNSSSDYQLPAVSYITALGSLIGGKTERGVRFPFIALGVSIVFFVFQISKLFSNKPRDWFLASLTVALSPALIYQSRIPNESIVLTFGFLSLLYLLTRRVINFVLVILMMAIVSLTAKEAWIILPIFVLAITHFFLKAATPKAKLIPLVSSIVIPLIFIVVFLSFPQANRSLMENNLNILTNMTIQNGVNKLRGQGLESGWPNVVERILFNKFALLTTGGIHFLSHFSPNIYFGQSDNSGIFNFSKLGLFLKAFFVPMLFGIIFIIRSKQTRERSLLIYPLIFMLPAVLIYPALSQKILSITIPFLAIVCMFGLSKFSNKITTLIFVLAIVELMANMLFIVPETKATNVSRPTWIKEIDFNIISEPGKQIVVSDDISGNDIVPFLIWYAPVNVKDGFVETKWPYMFRQTNFGHIKITGESNDIVECKQENQTIFLVSNRDLERIQKIKDTQPQITYTDSVGDKVAYLIRDLKGICIR